jgi:glutamate synthase domain-containing protein 3
MSGGLAFVLDRAGEFPTRVNRELVTLERTSEAREIELLKALITRHHEATHSARAREILADWPGALECFWTVIPKSLVAATARADLVLRYLEPLRALAAEEGSGAPISRRLPAEDRFGPAPHGPPP